MARYCHIYSSEQKQFLADNVTGRSYQELTDLFNQTFKLSLNCIRISSSLKRYGLKSGKDGRFKPGQKSWNLGLKGVHFSLNSEFKKGNIPHNHRPVGSERISRDGYLEVKVKEPKTWQLKHRVIWEKANGEIPKGFVVLFADGDKTNITLDNLLLISQHELLIINKHGLIFKAAALTRSGATVAKVIAKTEKLLKNHHSNNKGVI